MGAVGKLRFFFFSVLLCTFVVLLCSAHGSPLIDQGDLTKDVERLRGELGWLKRALRNELGSEEERRVDDETFRFSERQGHRLLRGYRDDDEEVEDISKDMFLVSEMSMELAEWMDVRDASSLVKLQRAICEAVADCGEIDSDDVTVAIVGDVDDRAVNARIVVRVENGQKIDEESDDGKTIAEELCARLSDVSLSEMSASIAECGDGETEVDVLEYAEFDLTKTLATDQGEETRRGLSDRVVSKDVRGASWVEKTIDEGSLGALVRVEIDLSVGEDKAEDSDLIFKTRQIVGDVFADRVVVERSGVVVTALNSPKPGTWRFNVGIVVDSVTRAAEIARFVESMSDEDEAFAIENMLSRAANGEKIPIALEMHEPSVFPLSALDEFEDDEDEATGGATGFEFDEATGSATGGDEDDDEPEFDLGVLTEAEEEETSLWSDAEDPSTLDEISWGAVERGDEILNAETPFEMDEMDTATGAATGGQEDEIDIDDDVCVTCSDMQMMRLGQLALEPEGVDAKCSLSIVEAMNEPSSVNFDDWCQCLLAIQDKIYSRGVPETLRDARALGEDGGWNCCLSSESHGTIAAQIQMCRLADKVSPECLDSGIAAPWTIGDGRCDLKYDTKVCDYDGGDCCADVCVDTVYECDRSLPRCFGGDMDISPPSNDEEEEEVRDSEGPYTHAAQADILFTGLSVEAFKSADSGLASKMRAVLGTSLHVSKDAISFSRVVPGVAEEDKDDTMMVKVQILSSNVVDARRDQNSLHVLFDNSQILTAALEKATSVAHVSALLVSEPVVHTLASQEMVIKAAAALESTQQESQRKLSAEMACVSDLEEKMKKIKDKNGMASWCVELFKRRGLGETIGDKTLGHVCDMVASSFDVHDGDVTNICRTLHTAVNVYIGGEPSAASGQTFPREPIEVEATEDEDRCEGHPERQGCNPSPCVPHGFKGCNDERIQACVCEKNSFCCEEEWDVECVDTVASCDRERCVDPDMTRYDESVPDRYLNTRQ